VIEDGGIPDPAAITVEGFLSEHSIPIPAPQQPRILYATMASTWHRDSDAFTPLATVQIGFGTNIDRNTFARDPLNVVVVIDKSGSTRHVGRVARSCAARPWPIVVTSNAPTTTAHQHSTHHGLPPADRAAPPQPLAPAGLW